MIFINGQEAAVSLNDLIAKGQELIAAGYPQATSSFNQDMNEATTAVHWYDEQHRVYVESGCRIASAEAEPARF